MIAIIFRSGFDSEKNNPEYRIFTDREILQEINGKTEVEDEEDGDELMPEEHVSSKITFECMQTVITHFEQQACTCLLYTSRCV